MERMSMPSAPSHAEERGCGARPAIRGDPLLSMVRAFGVPAAIMDQTGNVLGANRSWRDLARNQGPAAVTCDPGENYSEALDAGQRNGVGGAAALKNGVERVLSGRIKTVECDCRLIQDGVSQRFRVRISRVKGQAPARFLAQVEEVTSLVEAQELAREAGERLLEAQADERRRLALELHDSVGQNLVALGLSLSLLRMMAPKTSSVSKVIDDMSSSLQDADAQIRSLSYLLNPPYPVHEEGLERAVEALVHGFGSRAGLRVDISVDGVPRDVDLARQRVIFRILQEALVNIHRHAHANAVIVKLSHSRRELMLEVRDDGRGIPVQEGAVSPAGVGLSGMRARVREFGGEFQVVSGPTGTTVAVRLPLDDADSARSDSRDIGGRPATDWGLAEGAIREERSWVRPGRRPSAPKSQSIS